ncbi:hypothetical protein L1987_29576 [Smallanthus sonchifolius]|uniref:Uncharacterized protein n=1 Tax=Smallanthus sonchifolius TaxID=185202 RepID=A0ACB9I155_9ASTR|nr:hypothetical protein L1987_29576 [Smallanthus sonchifolius]
MASTWLQVVALMMVLVAWAFPTTVERRIRGFKLQVDQGKTYMLRIVNVALNEELFFRTANHKLTIVEVDVVYVKPFTTDTILIAPSQTTDAIITTTQQAGKYLMVVSLFMDAPIVVDNLTSTASLHYSGVVTSTITKLVALPPQNSTPVANSFINSLKSLNSATYPAKVPLTILCFSQLVLESILAKLVSMAHNHKFLQQTKGTKLYRLPYNSTVQLVLQDTGMITPESHPIHLHGFNFFVVGRGIGNFNPNKDPKSFNLFDPVERNTVGVPMSGWTAIRFRADNPGLKMAFVVDNRKGPLESITPPPSDLPVLSQFE